MEGRDPERRRHPAGDACRVLSRAGEAGWDEPAARRATQAAAVKLPDPVLLYEAKTPAHASLAHLCRPLWHRWARVTAVDGFQLTAELVKALASLAWPIVVLCMFYAAREPLLDLLREITELKFGNASATFARGVRKLPPETTANSAQLELPLPTAPPLPPLSSSAPVEDRPHPDVAGTAREGASGPRTTDPREVLFSQEPKPDRDLLFAVMNSPVYGVLRTWERLEEVVKSASHHRFGEGRPLPSDDILFHARRLQYEGQLSPADYELIADLRDLAGVAKRAERIELADALKFARNAFVILDKLRLVLLGPGRYFTPQGGARSTVADSHP